MIPLADYVRSILFRWRNPSHPTVSMPELERAVGENTKEAGKLTGVLDEILLEPDPFASMVHRMKNVKFERYIKEHGELPGSSDVDDSEGKP